MHYNISSRIKKFNHNSLGISITRWNGQMKENVHEAGLHLFSSLKSLFLQYLNTGCYHVNAWKLDHKH